jgi:hypothetical protein
MPFPGLPPFVPEMPFFTIRTHQAQQALTSIAPHSRNDGLSAILGALPRLSDDKLSWHCERPYHRQRPALRRPFLFNGSTPRSRGQWQVAAVEVLRLAFRDWDREALKQ